MSNSILISPKLPSVPNMAYWAKFFYFNLRREENSYERRDYESVDDKSLLLVSYQKSMKKKVRAVEG